MTVYELYQHQAAFPEDLQWLRAFVATRLPRGAENKAFDLPLEWGLERKERMVELMERLGFEEKKTQPFSFTMPPKIKLLQPLSQKFEELDRFSQHRSHQQHEEEEEEEENYEEEEGDKDYKEEGEAEEEEEAKRKISEVEEMETETEARGEESTRKGRGKGWWSKVGVAIAVLIVALLMAQLLLLQNEKGGLLGMLFDESLLFGSSASS
ncbi:nucleolar protein 14-like [Balamuthia mandrillaris]